MTYAPRFNLIRNYRLAIKIAFPLRNHPDCDRSKLREWIARARS